MVGEDIGDEAIAASATVDTHLDSHPVPKPDAGGFLYRDLDR